MSISKEDQFVLDKLDDGEHLSKEELDTLKEKVDQPLLSIYWEIKTMITLGVGLFSVGIGKLIYYNLNADTRSVVILLVLSIGFVLSGLYCLINKKAFSWEKVTQDDALFNGLLLLCTSLFITLEAFLQIEFNYFNDRFAEMAIIPTIFFFFCAYYFDNRTVLTKAMIAFAAWFAIEFKILQFDASILKMEMPLVPSILIGLSLLAIGYMTSWKDLKKHFKRFYLVFAVQMIMLALTIKFVNAANASKAGIVLLITFSLIFYGLSIKEKNHTILYTVFFYFFITLTANLNILEKSPSVISLYFIFSGLLFLFLYFIFRRNTNANV